MVCVAMIVAVLVPVYAIAARQVALAVANIHAIGHVPIIAYIVAQDIVDKYPFHVWNYTKSLMLVGRTELLRISPL